ncbi:MAG: hypothetical protein FJ030_01955 [Chloroflexi bacterium]|nr:hypothetical protein [Chloroflexota bacterium]
MHIYTTRRDGTDVQAVVRIPNTYTYNPTWSPDGELIAYHHSCGLGIVRPDGAGRRTLLESSGSWCSPMFAWSPDSQWIAMLFSVRDPTTEVVDSPTSVWIISRDGRNWRRVFNSEYTLVNNVIAWSPDGRTIAVQTEASTAYLIEADCNEKPNGCDASSRTVIADIPKDWFSNFSPQWAGENIADVMLSAATSTP